MRHARCRLRAQPPVKAERSCWRAASSFASAPLPMFRFSRFATDAIIASHYASMMIRCLFDSFFLIFFIIAFSSPIDIDSDMIEGHYADFSP
jgi:hypothetical protein